MDNLQPVRSFCKVHAIHENHARAAANTPTIRRFLEEAYEETEICERYLATAKLNLEVALRLTPVQQQSIAPLASLIGGRYV